MRRKGGLGTRDSAKGDSDRLMTESEGAMRNEAVMENDALPPSTGDHSGEGCNEWVMGGRCTTGVAALHLQP